MKSNTNHISGKKSFTLLEVVISVTIFSILLIFLYKVLDSTRYDNKQFKSKIESYSGRNHIYQILSSDVAQSIGGLEISRDKEKNTILKFRSNNTYYDPFHRHITYLVSSKANLIRMESKDKFQGLNSSIEFYDNSYIDILVKDIKRFVVIQKDDKVMFVIDKKDNTRLTIPSFKME